ncbi:hypothetical protein M9H77_04281 [Catharanthus roseus]|uniref:Uncharacterized protein n=1 Tax=Catharanthus roseus TaxID=4058 RepID=A0ACC0CE73_CATRO|nr:hypothetical protein M9H77_04281 [Catharanthus roseus]
MIDRVCDLPSLFKFSVEYNKVSGSIPECFRNNLTSLRTISLGSNRFDGLIPINLSTNLLSGSLPPEFGNMKAVILIDLSMNNISGNLPPSIGDLQNLQNLQLGLSQ